MSENAKRLFEILANEYGIRTAEELEREINHIKPVNIGMFTVVRKDAT